MATPPFSLLRHPPLIAAAVFLLFPFPGRAAPGGVDVRWTSLNIGGEIATAALHPDQGIWIAGNIDIQLTSVLRHLVRLLPSGHVDTLMVRQSLSPLSNLCFLPDSKLIIAGGAGASAVRLLPAGGNDITYNFNSSNVRAFGIGFDRHLILGRTQLPHLLRFSPTGAQDTAFTPGLTSAIHAISMLPGGACYAGGAAADGTGALAKISGDGVKDPAFAPVFDSPVLALASQADGKLLVSGRFTQVNGAARAGLVRLLPDGTTDASYQPMPASASGPAEIKTLLPQADGAVLISGNFDSINGIARPGMARLNVDGTLDSAFGFPDVARYGNRVKLLCLLPDGRVLVDVPGFPGKRSVIMLQNDAGSSSLSLTAPGELAWTRSGAVPAVAQAWFEVSDSAAGPWSDLGPAVRTADGWKLTVPDLPAQGFVRVIGTGPAAGGESTGSFVSDTLSLGAPVHSFALRRPDLLPSANQHGGFGNVWQGSPASIPLVLRNTGTGDLTGLTFNISGTDASAFALQPSPASTTLAAGRSMEFALTFTAAGPDSRTATLTVSADQPAAAPVTLTLSGRGTAQQNVTIDGRFTPAQRAEGFNADGLTLTGIILSPAPTVPPSQDLVLVNNVSDQPIQGILTGMPQGSLQVFPISGTPRYFRVDYQGGDGNDLVLRPVVFGSVDPALELRIPDTAQIDASIRLRNGSLLISGSFGYVDGKSRRGIIRLLPDGRLDETFHSPPVYNQFYALAETESGRILAASNYDLLNPLRRYHSDGTPDSSFSCSRIGILNGMLPLEDGRVLIVGNFYQDDRSYRNEVVRLNEDGSVDSTFTCAANQTIYCALLLPDGKVLVGGEFTEINGTARSYLARLNPDGTVDPTFSASAGTRVFSLARQDDGKIIWSANGPARLRRILENGTADSSFSQHPFNQSSSPFMCLSVQSNGKVLAGWRRVNRPPSLNEPAGITRLNSDGKLDTNFDLPLGISGTTGYVGIETFSQGGDGTLLVGGSFQRAGNFARHGLVLAGLEPPEQSLTVTSPSRIEWRRGGSLPASGRISFALHEPLTNTWTPLGPGTAIPGGWELTGLSLPADGAIRATAVIAGGRTSSSHAFSDSVLSFGNVVPDIVLRRTDGTALPHDTGVLAIGSAVVAVGKSYPLSLENHGSGLLGPLTASFEGPDAACFSVPMLPSHGLAAGQSYLLPIRFTPVEKRSHTARLILASNDPDEPAYAITLTGSGGAPIQIWRDDYFQTMNNEGAAANDADPDGDGLSNLAEYAIGLNPLTNSQVQPPVSVNGFLRLQLFRPHGRTDLDYGAESSSDPASADWLDLTNTGTSELMMFAIPLTGPRQFMRYRFKLLPD